MRLHRSRRQSSTSKNVDNQIKWLQEQGFADKGFDANTIIAKDYVKAD
ncbi:hypothetical protein BRDID11002_15210 [Bradyrhizobium diazoefficiens]